MTEIHVVPVDDLVEHWPNDDCPCGPTTEFLDGGAVVIHHSLDNREAKEAGA